MNPKAHVLEDAVITPAQAAMDLLVERGEAALAKPGAILGAPVTYDAERVSAIIARWQETTPGPWLVEEGKFSGRNWMVAFMGNGHDGKDYSITTDSVHASEMVTGGAQEDAEFIAHAWADVAYLVRLVQQMRLEQLRRTP